MGQQRADSRRIVLWTGETGWKPILHCPLRRHGGEPGSRSRRKECLIYSSYEALESMCNRLPALLPVCLERRFPVFGPLPSSLSSILFICRQMQSLSGPFLPLFASLYSLPTRHTQKSRTTATPLGEFRGATASSEERILNRQQFQLSAIFTV